MMKADAEKTPTLDSLWHVFSTELDLHDIHAVSEWAKQVVALGGAERLVDSFAKKMREAVPDMSYETARNLLMNP